MNISATINQRDFQSNDPIQIIVDVDIESVAARETAKQLDGLYLLLRAERAFDKQGRYHQFSNNYASTILTASGLPIENYDIFCEYAANNPAEYTGLLKPENRIHGYSNATPFDRTVFVKKQDLQFTDTGVKARFVLQDTIAADFIDGYYRLQTSIMGKYNNNFYRANFFPLFNDIASNFSDWDLAILSRTCSYLPMIKINNPQTPKMIWALFTKQFSNGMQGIIAEEDSSNFQFNSRHVVPADFILPAASHHTPALTLNLEPDLPTMLAKNVLELEQGAKWPFQTILPLNYIGGEITVKITSPDGKTKQIGPAPFAAESETGATTNNPEFQYTFIQSGKYSVKMEGWIEDIWGTHYNGGGTYNFWVANRLTFATSVKPGTPFTVGEGYPPSAIIHPPCAADISFDIKLFRNSSPDDIKQIITQGKANRFGYFYPRDEYEKMIFDCPGEYLSTITATYTDERGNFWMGSQRNGSVVAPINSKVIVHGVSPANHNMSAFNKRGNINYEGLISQSNNPEFNHYTVCTLFPFPYYSGDVLYVANSFKGDNGMLPGFKVSLPEEILPGMKNDLLPFSATSNNYQPQGYPEFLEKQIYGYTSAIRSGFVARYMVTQDTNYIWDAYWQSGGNFAGGQINNSYNGDLPQDIYGFMSGVVIKDFSTGINQYGIYASMGIIIPKGSYANRVVAPLTEPLVNINGRDHYITDVGAPLPGMVYELSDILRAGAMIFPPIEGVTCRRIITSPSGEIYDFKGVSNKIGLTKLVAEQGADVPITEPGVYEVISSCKFGDKQGDIIGSGDGKYYIYAVNKDDYKQYFKLDLAPHFKIDYKKILSIKGIIDPTIKDPLINYTIIMPGMIMDEGTLAVKDNSFTYNFSARDFAVQFPQYDIVDYADPQKQVMADTVIFTFFLTGQDVQGLTAHSVQRFILRGDTGLVLK
ncbi:MAG: hypothetical protein KJ915_08850 [Candidatus Omnitrophica bacterium]|nr:hypothetical protein [Candidatus Omnitrophota bacterium]